jgi:antitoxin component of MazEF toxin-antitoxin module
MPKPQKLVTVGNSFAITIDKRTCRLLRLDRTTEFSVTLEGKDSILLRPVRREDRSGQPDRFRLHQSVAALIQSYGMTDREFQPLSHDGRSFRTFLLDVDVGGHMDLTTVDRLKLCLQLRSEAARAKQHVPWEDTIRRVLELIPDRPVPKDIDVDPSLDGTLLAPISRA